MVGAKTKETLDSILRIRQKQHKILGGILKYTKETGI